MKQVEPVKSLELKKHVAVIHSGNKLTLLQRKIANALLFNAYKDLLSKDEHQIHITTLCKLIGYRSNDYKTIKTALVALLSTVLQWNLMNDERLDDEGIWSASSIIADASIDGPICTYSYSNKMRKLLYRPNIYGRLDMIIQQRFQSSYGLALYENCNRFQDIGKTPWINLQTFRVLMGVNPEKYKVFRDFKHRVLDKAIDEVNQYSHIRVEPIYKKIKRQIVAIQFKISKISIQIMNTDADSEVVDLTNDLRQKFKLSCQQVKNIFSKYEKSYIQEKIILIENSSSFKEEKIVNLAQYFLAALTNDYKITKAATRSRTDQTKKTQHKKNIDEKHHSLKNQKLRELEIRYRRFQDKEMLRIFNETKGNKKTHILKQFHNYMYAEARGVYQSIYEKEGIKNPLIQDQLVQFLIKILPEMILNIVSFAEWKKNEQLVETN